MSWLSGSWPASSLLLNILSHSSNIESAVVWASPGERDKSEANKWLGINHAAEQVLDVLVLDLGGQSCLRDFY